MSKTIVAVNELYDAYRDSLGVEAAEKLVNDAIVECGLKKQPAYPVEDILKICDVLKSKPGFIRIVAGFLRGRYLSERKG